MANLYIGTYTANNQTLGVTLESLTSTTPCAYISRNSGNYGYFYFIGAEYFTLSNGVHDACGRELYWDGTNVATAFDGLQVPVFNNATDAGYYKDGLSYDASNIVGGHIPTPPTGQEIPVIYTDKVNYMSIQSYGSDKCNLRFYLNGNCIYTLPQISTDAYLSMLVDEEQELARTSIIYEGSSTYSYNTEEPTETEMENLYKWLTANNQMDEFGGFVETEENGEWVEEVSATVPT